MTENQPYDTSPASAEISPINDWRETRREAQTARHDGGAWIWGAFLILLGLGFLAENMGLFAFRNWWALFILIPALGSFQSAWKQYHEAGGRLSGPARGSLIGGMILTTVAVVFLFELSFGTALPFLLLLAGAALLVSALLPG